MMTIQKYWPKMLKNCQTMTPGLGILVIVNCAVFLSACGSNPKVVQQVQQKQAAASTYRPLVVQQPVVTALGNVYWDIEQISGSPANIYTTKPYLYFMAGSQLNGSTGCNSLSGSYRETGNQLRINVLASHMSCGGAALVQEAELMDSLARISAYQLNQNVLQLFDANNRLLVRARKR